MFRVKIGLLAALLVILLTVVIYLTIVTPLSTGAKTRVRSSVARAAKLVTKTQRLQAYDLLSKAQEIADSDLLKAFKQSVVSAPELPWQAAEGTPLDPAVKKLFFQGSIICPRKVSRVPGLGGTDEETRKKRQQLVVAWDKTFSAIESIDKALVSAPKPRSSEVFGKPAFVGIIGKKGTIVARDMDADGHWCGSVLTYTLNGGKKILFKNIMAALTGVPSTDIWDRGAKMWRAAATPVKVAGKVEGALIIAYEITNAEARKERDQFGTHVAYFKGGNVQGDAQSIMAFSFSQAGSTSKEDAPKADALRLALFAARKKADEPMLPGDHVAKSLTDKTPSEPFRLSFFNEKYDAITGFLPGQTSHQNAGFVVLTSLTEANKPVNRIRWMILVMGIFSMILVLGGMYIITRHFVSAEDKLELGVSEVINGNLEYIFEGKGEFEGLANAINVMLARLLGRPEPGEEMDEDEAMLDPTVLLIGEADDADTGSEMATKLAAEIEEAYHARLYKQYLDTRQEYGLPTEGLEPDTMIAKLKANEALLKAKYKADRIRFAVDIDEDGRVVFKPVLI